MALVVSSGCHWWSPTSAQTTKPEHWWGTTSGTRIGGRPPNPAQQRTPHRRAACPAIQGLFGGAGPLSFGDYEAVWQSSRSLGILPFRAARLTAPITPSVPIDYPRSRPLRSTPRGRPQHSDATRRSFVRPSWRTPREGRASDRQSSELAGASPPADLTVTRSTPSGAVSYRATMTASSGGRQALVPGRPVPQHRPAPHQQLPGHRHQRLLAAHLLPPADPLQQPRRPAGCTAASATPPPPAPCAAAPARAA